MKKKQKRSFAKGSISKASKSRSPGLRRWLGELQILNRLVRAGVTTRLLLILTCLAIGAAILWAMERSVLNRQGSAGPVSYRVELTDTPGWMSHALVRELHEALTPQVSFTDESLCREVYRLVEKNPWISDIQQVRRFRRADRNEGVIMVTATYRQPIARVQYDHRTYFIDTHGVVLPFDSVPKWAAKIGEHYRYYTSEDAVPLTARPMRIHYTTIQGVTTPPVEVGETWVADDLKHGLRLIELINTRHWANQITVVDVRNHKRRISESEPELRLYAQQGRGRSTDILFGRFPFPQGGDWVISPDRKIKYLDDYVSEHNGKLAGINSYIDVRYDELHISVN